MSPTSQGQGWAPARPAGGRWLLLAFMVLGLLAVHSLSGHGSGDHRLLAPSAAIASSGLMSPTAAPAIQPIENGDPGDGHELGGDLIVEGCALLLAAAAFGLLPRVRRKAFDRPRQRGLRAPGGDRVRPAQPLSRLILCVVRI